MCVCIYISVCVYACVRVYIYIYIHVIYICVCIYVYIHQSHPTHTCPSYAPISSGWRKETRSADKLAAGEEGRGGAAGGVRTASVQFSRDLSPCFCTLMACIHLIRYMDTQGMCCSVLQCVAVCCSVLQCAYIWYVTWIHISHKSCHVHTYVATHCNTHKSCHVHALIACIRHMDALISQLVSCACISSGTCMYACFEVLASAHGLFSHFFFLYLIRRAVQGDPGTVPVMKICITCITCITDAFARLADVRKLEETRHSSQHTFSRDIYRSLSPTKTYEYGNNPIHQKRTYRYEKIWKATCMTTDAT